MISAARWGRLADFCQTLPGTTHDIKWEEHHVYSVGEKMYVIFNTEPARSERISLPADPERFLELTDQPGIIPAPYLARYRWVQINSEATLSDAELQELVRAAHARVLAKLPARRRREILAGEGGQA